VVASVLGDHAEFACSYYLLIVNMNNIVIGLGEVKVSVFLLDAKSATMEQLSSRKSLM